MATAHHTRTVTPERFVQALQRASVADVEQTVTRKRTTALEAAMLRMAHAMLHGGVEAADQWMHDYPNLLADDILPMRTLKLARPVDTVADTV